MKFICLNQTLDYTNLTLQLPHVLLVLQKSHTLFKRKPVPASSRWHSWPRLGRGPGGGRTCSHEYRIRWNRGERRDVRLVSGCIMESLDYVLFSYGPLSCGFDRGLFIDSTVIAHRDFGP